MYAQLDGGQAGFGALYLWIRVNSTRVIEGVKRRVSAKLDGGWMIMLLLKRFLFLIMFTCVFLCT